MKPEVNRKSLAELRREIDELDRRLFALIAQRMAIARDIGTLKRAQGASVSDPVREALLKAKLKEFASGVLEPWHVEELASVILRISRDLQTRPERK
ncbi:MAG: chorismate mutase [Candidatus Neomarinimicrobiota bacterium]